MAYFFLNRSDLDCEFKKELSIAWGIAAKILFIGLSQEMTLSKTTANKKIEADSPAPPRGTPY